MELLPNSLRPHVEVPARERQDLESLRDLLTEDQRELLLEYAPA